MAGPGHPFHLESLRYLPMAMWYSLSLYTYGDLVPQSGLDLGDTYRALFWGVILSALLFGLTNVQACIYFQTHTSKGVVIWLWTLDALHLAFSIHYVYYYLVSNYANVIALTEVVWSFKLQALLNVLIISGVHLLYCHRIWTISKDRASPFLIIVSIVIVASLGESVTWKHCTLDR
ncbi:uncharacterized protein EDB91DRAFT_888722 [Suillus paluster]|uniref:uncharacterized protein n=1 Tax=Suillus paluster TaxID=48578 RepID=UPI001B85CD96|nr:uncharacterized protein EDB91DRAFT_888722 [Suillus paluster]KAG1727667.1 hypothetical protein EDB91DRAFT_888722 [Suillus paluster]